MVINTRSLSLSSRELGQGDSDTIIATLFEDSIEVDPTGAHAELHIAKENGTPRHIIRCDVVDRKVIIPFSEVETSKPGLYFCQMPVEFPQNIDSYFGDNHFSDPFFGEYFGVDFVQHTFPSSKSVSFRVEAAI